MGRRSSFTRIKGDFYETVDPRAVAPLLAHLPRRVRYSEPCAGGGALIDLLAPHAECVWSSDIEPKRQDISQGDMMQSTIGEADMWITNPPWTRSFLHPLIVHLSDQAPAALLFDANWSHTKQAQPFMSRCRKIISVGRVKWMPGTKMTGKEDAAWYIFDKPMADRAPLFFTATAVPAAISRNPVRVCFDCGCTIGQNGKWTLAQREGVLTPVHRFCDNPDSYYAKGAEPISPAPLLDWLET